MGRQWLVSKAQIMARVTSYIGVMAGVMFLTALIPLVFLSLGETSSELIGVHCGSVVPIAYWTIGYGGVTSLLYFIIGIVSLKRLKAWNILALSILVLHFFTSVILSTLGAIKSDEYKTFFREMWDDMAPETTNLIESYFSCCGFETAKSNHSTNPRCASQHASSVWPIGCYDSLYSSRYQPISIDTWGGETVTISIYTRNPIIIIYVIFFVSIILLDILTMTSFALLITSPLNSHAPVSLSSPSHVLTISNSHTNEKLNEQSTVNEPAYYDENNKDMFVLDLDEGRVKMKNEIEEPKHPKEFQLAKKKKITMENVLDLPNFLTEKFEDAFYWLGVKVGTFPKTTILLSLLMTGAISIGLVQRRDVGFGSAAFLPRDLPLLDEVEHFYRTFTTNGAQHQIIIVADNVLDSETFHAMARVDQRVKSLNASGGFENICVRYKSGTCKQRSVFELWNYDYDIIANVTDDIILDKLSYRSLHQSSLRDFEIESLLGGIEYDARGNIISAKASMMQYATIRQNSEWELEFVSLGQSSPEGLDVYVRGENSQTNEAQSGMTNELPLLFAGFGLLFIYISLMTGKFSLVQHRVWIALIGVLTAGLSLAAGIGLAASITFEWSMLHLLGPFLLLGIGVDDMFILLQTWNVVDEDKNHKNKSVEEKAGYVLKTAGVAITITSVTDLVAFAVGSTSVLIPFRSFSIYVALCIIILFGLQCTFFMACIVLDQKRRLEKRDSCLPCFRHGEDYQEGRCADLELFQKFFAHVLGRVLQSHLVKGCVILVTIVTTVVLAWGFSNLRIGYEPDWYIDSDSYLISYNKQYEKYYEMGLQSGAYVINSDFFNERDQLHNLYLKLDANVNVDSTFLNSWYEEYTVWYEHFYKQSELNETVFYQTVQGFLDTEAGKIYQDDVVFRNGKIIGSRFPFRHVVTEYSVDNAITMEAVREDMTSIGFTGHSFPFSWLYFNLEIITIIKNEVYRNIGITMLCVFLMVLPLMGSLQMGFWVGLCVVFTIVDVAGAMYLAGFYIETSTVIVLLLAVGLAVDYAAHIGHKFLTLTGSRNHRMRVTLAHVGPAVFNGGFSTFLALSLLAGSHSYSYKVFFTIFTCVVVFGLWNGLCFLPSVLGLIGPQPYKHNKKKPEEDKIVSSEQNSTSSI